jgi:hypothetical protein
MGRRGRTQGWSGGKQGAAGVDEVVEWRRWELRQIGTVAMGGTLDQSDGDRWEAGLHSAGVRGLDEARARGAGQLGAPDSIGRGWLGWTVGSS